MTNKDFHVAIVGAGVGGLALAMALHKRGISFTVYEDAPEFSVVGAGIGCAPNGMRTMDLIEPGFRPLYDAICVGNKGEEAQSIFFEGLLLEKGFGLDRPWAGRSGWGHPNYIRKSAHRKELLDVMTSFLPADSVEFSKHLTGVEQSPSGVTLTFADGTTAHADMVAGADGIKSTVRAHVLQDHPEQIAPKYASAYCYRGVIPMTEAQAILGDLTDVAKNYFGRDRGLVTYRITGGTEFNFLYCVADAADGWKLNGPLTEPTTREAMLADFAGDDVDPRLRTMLEKAKPIKWGLFHHLHTATYARDRVVLVGDSAHASMPFQALGAAMGLEDALVLASVVAELAAGKQRGPAQMEAIRAGVAAYDAVRRPRAQRQLEQADDAKLLLFFRHEEAGDDMEKILPRMQHGRFEWLWFHDMQDDVVRALADMRTRLDAGPQVARI